MLCSSGEFAENYKKNKKYIESYRWWRHGKLPEWKDLISKVERLKDNYYLYWCSNLSTSHRVKIERTMKDMEPFFRSLDKPLLIMNNFNSYHWEYLDDNIRRSEDFGTDNHIYMYYDRIEDFYALIQVIDIVSYLKNEKFVFVFGKDSLSRDYVIDFKKEYGIDYSSFPPKQIAVDEIKRILLVWIAQGYSGNVLLSGILDFHKNLLTIQRFGLVGFHYIYENLLHQCTVMEVFAKLETNADPVIYEELKVLFYPYSSQVPKMKEFFTILNDLFPTDSYRPSRIEWFKGFFLAYSIALNKDLNQRVAPMIVFQTHMVAAVTTIGDNLDFLHKFAYFRILSVIRRPSIAMASECSTKSTFPNFTGNYLTFLIEALSLSWQNIPENKRYSTPLFLREDSSTFPFHGVIRFEDLKMHPKATMESVCDFIDIAWDDSFLTITYNGDVADFDTKGFDVAPVYNLHQNAMNILDYYRIEMLIGKEYLPWGYKPLYCQDTSMYSKKDILTLFKLPFKCENLHYTLMQKKSTRIIREALYKVVQERLSRPANVTVDGEVLLPLKWIKPKIEFLHGDLYE